MKNLLWAILMALLAIGMPCLAFKEYRDVVALHDHGTEGFLSVRAKTGSTRSRRGATTHQYDAYIEGVRVRIRTSDILSPGYRYPVLFAPEKLRDYSSQASGAFSSYKIGRRAESAGDIFVRDIGKWLLWGMVGLEILWIVGVWLFWSSFKKGEEA